MIPQVVFESFASHNSVELNLHGLLNDLKYNRSYRISQTGMVARMYPPVPSQIIKRLERLPSSLPTALLGRIGLHWDSTLDMSNSWLAWLGVVAIGSLEQNVPAMAGVATTVQPRVALTTGPGCYFLCFLACH